MDPDSLRTDGLLLRDGRFLDYITTEDRMGVPLDVWRSTDGLTVQVIRQRHAGYAQTVMVWVFYADRVPSLFEVGMACEWFFTPNQRVDVQSPDPALPQRAHAYRLMADPDGTPRTSLVWALWRGEHPGVTATV